jgi:hypothetical protein
MIPKHASGCKISGRDNMEETVQIYLKGLGTGN